MRNKGRKYNVIRTPKIKSEQRHRLTFRSMACILCVIFMFMMADVLVANATSEDEAQAEHILDNDIDDEEYRTTINEPGASQTGEELKELNIANSLTITLDDGNGELSGELRVLLVLTAIAVLPILLITVTSFTRVLIVLHFTRQALNTQSAPPNQVLIAISLFLTFFIMQPTFTQIYTDVVVPYDAGEINAEEALNAAAEPLRHFMFTQTQMKDIDVFMQLSNTAWDGKSEDQVPTAVLIPSFIISELRTAFIIGFIIYIPFIVIDMVVASVLMSMGMMMLPPTTISMPFKILLFVLADGWNLVIVNLVRSFLVQM